MEKGKFLNKVLLTWLIGLLCVGCTGNRQKDLHEHRYFETNPQVASKLHGTHQLNPVKFPEKQIYTQK